MAYLSNIAARLFQIWNQIIILYSTLMYNVYIQKLSSFYKI
jgi:hypothetical protein